MGGRPVRPRVEGNVVHGRGACDMKARLAAVLTALTAIRTAGVRLRGRLAVHFVVGEEDGGLGLSGPCGVATQGTHASSPSPPAPPHEGQHRGVHLPDRSAG
ncbi:M20/M25/M40 family metallo-hydrolase [Streptomyces rubrogriseus]|uniref:M20/M25/M40 family metallo-hydrolase n=1 Tax=Streptomyces rubrogriseus TaxID=194673 RepID=UPI002F40D93E